MLYTDGLVERRGESIDDGLERLQALSAGGGDIEALCARLVDGLAPEPHPDDVAIIAARVPPPPERLSGALARRARGAGRRPPAAAPLAARAGRDRGRDLRHHRGLPGGVRERGRARVRPGRNTFDLEATASAGASGSSCATSGRWRPPRGTDRGRGLLMMRELMDTVDVSHTDAARSWSSSAR